MGHRSHSAELRRGGARWLGLLVLAAVWEWCCRVGTKAGHTFRPWQSVITRSPDQHPQTWLQEEDGLLSARWMPLWLALAVALVATYVALYVVARALG